MKRIHFTSIIICFTFLLSTWQLLALSSNDASKYVKAGPMLGHVEHRTAIIWIEVAKDVNKLSLHYWKKGDATTPKKHKLYQGALGKSFNPCTFYLEGLLPHTTYVYSFVLEDAKGRSTTTHSYEVTTTPIWQWRTPAPDFSFLAGSCAYVNEPPYDRPGEPYGKNMIIFNAMAKEDAAFMLWLGDNWYTREADYGSVWGLTHRASHTRSAKEMQPLLLAMSHYAIWDDHCYGPNNSNKSYIFRDESRKIFKRYWGNPSYGQKDEGIYTAFSYSDVDFFLLDNRYFRTSDVMKDSLDGQLNPHKGMLGEKQMEWLKNQLLSSRGSFKVIACGSQILSTTSPYESLYRFPIEYKELLQFLEIHRIPGVLFFSGDRHWSSVVKQPRENAYTLFDITSSSLTAGSYRAAGAEKTDPNLVLSVDDTNNYSVISVSGKRGERELEVAFKDKTGKLLNSWKINQKNLK